MFHRIWGVTPSKAFDLVGVAVLRVVEMLSWKGNMTNLMLETPTTCGTVEEHLPPFTVNDLANKKLDNELYPRNHTTSLRLKGRRK